MERILVTGGAGFIGSHTVDLLLARGYRVRVLDSLAAPVHPRPEKPAYLSPAAEFVLGDVRDRETLARALRGVDAVFHLAAYQDYLPDFSTFFDVNSVGTALLYEVIVRDALPVRKVVVASSQSVYGEGKYRCPAHGVIYPEARSLTRLAAGEWEPVCPVVDDGGSRRCAELLRLEATDEAVVQPHNPYAISKYSQEMIALTLGRRHGIPSVAMRYSITQGPRQSFTNAYSGILRIFTLRLLNGRAPVAYEDGGQLRDYVSVFDVAEANLTVLERAEADYQVFNVGGERAVSVLQYAHLLARRLGQEIAPSLPGEFRLGDTRHILSDTARLRRLGWEPRVEMETIIDQYVEWARRQPGARDCSLEAEAVMKSAGVLRAASPL
jgi:dTDP-L-rhamnose 4-epimerase